MYKEIIVIADVMDPADLKYTPANTTEQPSGMAQTRSNANMPGYVSIIMFAAALITIVIIWAITRKTGRMMQQKPKDDIIQYDDHTEEDAT